MTSRRYDDRWDLEEVDGSDQIQERFRVGQQVLDVDGSERVAVVPRARRQRLLRRRDLGLSITAYSNKKLIGSPSFHTTGFNNVPYASYGLDLATGGTTPTDGASIRATGKMLLATAGTRRYASGQVSRTAASRCTRRRKAGGASP
jgi:hypothetical protein